MEIDTSRWSGEGEFTALLVERLQQVPEIAVIRVEDAQSTRSEADYNFIDNEVYVALTRVRRQQPSRRFGFLPGSRTVTEKAMTVSGLEAALATVPEIGAPDYSDDVMLQYLRTQRIVPPCQTRSYKLVELVRVYEVAAEKLSTR